MDFKTFEYEVEEQGEKLLGLDFKQRADFYVDVVIFPREGEFGVIYLLKDWLKIDKLGKMINERLQILSATTQEFIFKNLDEKQTLKSIGTKLSYKLS